MSKHPHPRSLFINDSEDSKKALELLREKGFTFCLHSIKGEDPEYPSFRLPWLITGTGDAEGLGAIQRYIEWSIGLNEVD